MSLYKCLVVKKKNCGNILHTVRYIRKRYSVSLWIAGNSLELSCYNMGRKVECECLKSRQIGQSAANLQHKFCIFYKFTIQNYCCILYTCWRRFNDYRLECRGSPPKWRAPKFTKVNMVNDIVYAHMKVWEIIIFLIKRWDSGLATVLMCSWHTITIFL